MHGPDLSDALLWRERAYVAGAWVAAADGATLGVRDPSDGAVIGAVPKLGAAQAEAAIDAAHGAWGPWAALLPQERARLLRRWFELMTAAREDLASIMTAEQGKPISEARGEIDYAASFIEFYAEEARRPNIEGVTSHLPDAEVEVWREPVGVAALVTPWNFPSAMITRKAAAALAAGCTVLVHPSAETPFSALALAALAERAGLPAGVFNVLTGEAATVVGPWTRSALVRALSFTGSTEVGRLLYGQCAGTIKRLTLELGGHAPFLMFADADPQRVAAEAVKAKFATSGQDCLAANRLLIQRPVYGPFCDAFAAATAKLSVGRGIDDPDIGPLMNETAVAKSLAHIEDATRRGARVLTGGGAHTAGPLFVAPTVLADAPPDALIFREETFGPVAAVTPFDTEEEALRLANAGEYGLVAYLHTEDPRRIFRLSRALSYGMVAVNRTKVTGAPIPFGGFKQSGLGREGSRLGLEAFTDVKYVCRDWA